MFKYICVLAVVGACSAASIAKVETSTEKKEIIPVLKFETDKKPDGSFSFMYEGGDKSFRQESGVVENAGTDDEALEVSGSYRYIDADGREVEVHYTAGKNGFVPVGTNILSEITAVARAAADLPNQSEDEAAADAKKIAHDNPSRRARSKAVEQETAIVQATVEEKKTESVVENPVEVKVEEKKVEEVKKPEEEKKPEEAKKPEEEKKAEEKKPEETKVEEKKS